MSKIGRAELETGLRLEPSSSFCSSTLEARLLQVAQPTNHMACWRVAVAVQPCFQLTEKVFLRSASNDRPCSQVLAFLFAPRLSEPSSAHSTLLWSQTYLLLSLYCRHRVTPRTSPWLLLSAFTSSSIAQPCARPRTCLLALPPISSSWLCPHCYHSRLTKQGAARLTLCLSIDAIPHCFGVDIARGAETTVQISKKED